MSPEILPQLFNNYVELHTAQLGVLLGLFVGLLYRDRPTLAYALLFFGVLSALGNASHIGFKPHLELPTEIERKPWYFLSALYFTTVGNILILNHGSLVASRLTVLFRALGITRGSGSEDVGPSEERM